MKNYSISFVRFMAVLLIIGCHLLQHIYISNLAWVFNVGVQIFLVVSGYLYGGGSRYNVITRDPVSFIKKNAVKILSKYITFWIILLFVLSITKSGGSGFPEAFQWLVFQEPVKGYGHIWFIPYILLCYCLTPILLCYFRTLEKAKDVYYLIALLIGVEIVFDFFIVYFNPAWINCYIVGLYMGMNSFPAESKHEKKQLLFTGLICMIALFVNCIRFWMKYCDIRIDGYWNTIYQRFTNYAHVLLGISVFLICYLLFSLFSSQRKCEIKRYPLLDISDKYSFDIFFVHPFFISGALSVRRFTNVKFLASIIALSISIAAAIILHWFDKGLWLTVAHILNLKRTKS